MDTEISLAVKIEKKKGEEVRAFLRDIKLIRSDLKLGKDDNFLFIPIKSHSPLLSDLVTTTFEFEKTKQKISSYQQLLSLPDGIQQLLPSSFDIIGDILLINLSEELHDYSKEIGTALLNAHSHVETICAIQPVSGELRTRSVTVIAGKQKTETIHKENGLYFEVNVEKTYFSPRLATERKRISDLIKKDSFVVDMFCGVAPFSIMIARFSSPNRIVAIDKNEYAIKLANHNIIRNSVDDNIVLINQDAKKMIKILSDYEAKPDHIIMNLPFSAFDFFPLAINTIAKNGMIHYYDIIEESLIERRLEQLKNIAEKFDTKLVKTKIHKIKTYAPHEFYIGIDITVSKN